MTINKERTRSLLLQCESCRYLRAEDLLHCKKYEDREKEEGILYAKKECEYFKDRNELSFNETDEKRRRMLGSLFTFVVGDALGVPVEFKSRCQIEQDPVKGMRAYGTYAQPFGTWSDDTSLMLALIDALQGGFSMSKLADNLVGFYRKAKFTPYHEVFDIGITTLIAVENLERGLPFSRCGGSGEQDNGNGSLMRILPLGLQWDSANTPEMIERIKDISALTHAHPRSVLACIFYSYLIHLLIEGRKKLSALEESIEFVQEHCRKGYSEEFQVYDRIFSKSILQEKREFILSSGYVVHTLEAAIWCFMNGNTVKDILLTAVNLGGDTDTITAITGGLAGACYGIEAVPNNWIQLLAQKEKLARIFADFIDSIETGRNASFDVID